jgi:hypothetical protein
VPQAVHPHLGVPLIREGRASADAATNASPFRFADPADLLRPASPEADYGLLWSTGTQRVLFRRPKIEKGSRQITSDETPLLADVFALSQAVGLFPPPLACLQIPFASSYALDVQGEGRLRLTLPSATFPAATLSGKPERELVASPTSRMYTDETDTRITVSIDPSAPVPWSYEQTGIAIVKDADGFSRLLTTRGSIRASAAQPPTFTLEPFEFGPALDPAKPFVPFLRHGCVSPKPGGGCDYPSPPLDQLYGEAEPSKVKFGGKFEGGIPLDVPFFFGKIKEAVVEVFVCPGIFEEFEITAAIQVLFFEGVVYFKFESEAQERKALPEAPPGTKKTIEAGRLQTLTFAVGVEAAGAIPLSAAAELEGKFFLGAGFKRQPGGTSVDLGLVYYAKLSLSLRDPLPDVFSAGVTLEGIAYLVRRGQDTVAVVEVTIALEVTCAFYGFEIELAEEKFDLLTF